MKILRPLTARAALFAGLFATLPALHAQWKTETYTLKGGWTAIWLHGDATHATPAELFAAYPNVLEVRRWNPNPDQVQYSESPSVPDSTSSQQRVDDLEARGSRGAKTHRLDRPVRLPGSL